MTIYRGPGGAGDATNDAIVNTVAAYATSAASSADNAANSASAASTSATNASTSATNAASSASQAATSASNSAASASTASTQASTATAQANNAAASAIAASSSAASASTYASNAASSASTATSKAAEAETYAIRAETAETNAETAYANTLDIFGDATDVANAVAAASTSATNAANSATTAASSATAASGSATTAGNYASAALNSANTANAEASEAQSAANTAVAALQSAQAIYGGLDDVTAAVNEAEDWATQSANSATASSASSSAAQTSATNAANSATQSAASAASAAAIVTGVASNRASIRPSLLLDFANSKTLDPRISYARASAGTYTDVFGTVNTAASGASRFTHEPTTGESLGMIIEPQRTNLVLESAGYDKQNLFTYSGTFDNAAWVKTRSAVTSGQADPFGGTGAFKLTEDTSTNNHYIVQSPSTTSGVPYVLSVYAKAGERNFLAFWWNSVADTRLWFDLQNGTVGSSTGTAVQFSNPTITSVGSGWYRCSVKILPTGNNQAILLCIANADATINYTGTTGSGIYIYGAQVERSYGTTPSAYYATTSAAYQPWVTAQTTLTPNAGTAPDGTNSAYKVVAVSGQTIPSNTNYLRTAALTVTNGAAYTTSVYAKAAGYNSLNLRFSSGANLGSTNGVVVFNLSTGAVEVGGGAFNATIQSVGNGWYRCSVTGSAAATTHYAGIWNDDTTATTADGTSGILLWGFQVEQASDASTYILTTTSQATRAADVLSLADSGWLNQSEGTFYVDRKLRAVNDNQTLFSLDNGTSDVKVMTVLGTNSVNLLTYSEQFETPFWSRSNSTVSSNATVAPDGTTTADKLVETTATGSHYTDKSGANAVTITSGVTYTFSVYAKAAERTSIFLRGAWNTAGQGANFDLANGICAPFGGSTSAAITSVGNGWYRCSVTATSTVTSAAPGIMLAQTYPGATSYTGDGTSGAYIWGAQLEAASSASTYEPNPKYITSYEIGSTGLIQTAPYASADLPNLYPRMTFGYKANDATFYRGGSSVGTDTSVTLPTSMNRLVIGGSAINSGREINGTIKRLAYFPRRLVNSEQEGIST